MGAQTLKLPSAFALVIATVTYLPVSSAVCEYVSSVAPAIEEQPEGSVVIGIVPHAGVTAEVHLYH
jgi:hypothetical protein